MVFKGQFGLCQNKDAFGKWAGRIGVDLHSLHTNDADHQ